MNGVNIFHVVANLFRCLWYPNSTRYTFLGVFWGSIVVSFILVHCSNMSSLQTTDYLTLLSSLFGFCFAGMAILVSMPSDSLAKLDTSINKKDHCECMKPYGCKKLSNGKCLDDLFATMSLGVIVPLIGIIGCLIRPYFPINHCVCFIIKMAILLFSLLWSIHITIHFFMLRSTLTKK